MISNKKIKGISLGTVDNEMSPILRAWRNDPKIYRWSRQNDLLTEACHAQWMKIQQEQSKSVIYLIRDGNTPVGVCGFSNIDLINQRAEFSVYIGPEYHRQGYGKDALKLLIWHGFNNYPFNIIYGETFHGNPALKLFESLGFALEGFRREAYFKDGDFIDSNLISIKRGEFKL